MDFVVCLFVVVKGYCQVGMMLLDLVHDTSVNDELIDYAQYAFYSSQFFFVPYFIHYSVLSHVFCHQARQDLMRCIEACNWTVILFITKIFRFWKQSSSSRQPPLRNHPCIHVHVCECLPQSFLCWFEFLPPKVLDPIYSWCCPVFSISNLFLHILVSDDKFTHKICSLAQFSFHLFHQRHIWRWLVLLPDASPKLNKSLHLRHFTFALFHCFQSPKKVFSVLLEHNVMFLPIAFSMYFSNFTFL